MKNVALPRSLKISIAVIICLNILVFSFLGASVNRMSEGAIEDIGTADSRCLCTLRPSLISA